MGVEAVRAESKLTALLRSWDAADPAVERSDETSTSARLPLPDSYPSADVDHERPGEYPYTRGITPRMFKDELWVMGQYSGYASASATNQRFKDLLAAGQTGLSIALDLPTQLGLGSDDPLARGEVGRVGVPLDTVDDVLALLDGLPLDRIRQIRTTANAIAPMFVAMLEVALEELGESGDGFRLLLQNDPLKEYSARGTFIFPPLAGLQLAVDVIEHLARERSHWEPIEFCGYHIRDAGGTAIDEVAIATANGIAYLDAAEARGVDIARLAHSLFLFMSSGVDVFEETAKLRAARRLWAKLLHERYGVPREDAGIKLFVYTLGGALVAQEPLNNTVRVAYEALAAVLGGVQTLAASSYDEALGLPTAGAAHLALRTQQIIAHESGATKVADPLAGSYYVEDLTDRIEHAVVRDLLVIAEQGGAVAALESGWLGARLADSSYRLQRETESGERPVVGVNLHVAEAESISEVFRVPDSEQELQLQRLAAVRERRSPREVARTLRVLGEDAAAGRNVIPALVEAMRARATLAEAVDCLRAVLGSYRAPAVRL